MDCSIRFQFLILGPMAQLILSALLDLRDAVKQVLTIVSFRGEVRTIAGNSLSNSRDQHHAEANEYQLNRTVLVLCLGIFAYMLVLVDVTWKVTIKLLE